MAITPYAAGGRIQIFYSWDGVRHRVDFNVGALVSGGAGTSGWQVTARGGLATADSALSAMVGDLQGVFSGATSIESWVLEQFIGGVFVPQYTATIGLSGTQGGSPVPAGQATWVARDTIGKQCKIVLFEANYAVPQHQVIAIAGGSNIDSSGRDWAINDVLHTGYYAQSRSGHFLSQCRTFTASLNKRIRRRRLLV